MDAFLNKLTQQAVNYAIRSGVTLTASYALRQTGRLMNAVEDDNDRQELELLQDRLQSKIKIISPAIDMIELISARGNTTLESAVELTNGLRSEIQSLAQQLERVATSKDLLEQREMEAITGIELKAEFKSAITNLRKLLTHIEDAVPFLNLALTTSGAKLSTTIPQSVAPSRLLQASTFLTAADSQFAKHNSTRIQVGPVFTLSLYMLFSGYLRSHSEEDFRESTWKEVIHKARVKVERVPLDNLGSLVVTTPSIERRLNSDLNADTYYTGLTSEFAYQLIIVEDFDDDRMHDFDDDKKQPEPFEDITQSGIKEAIPIQEIAKIFYADTGKILNIGDNDTHRPVLLLKRDKSAASPECSDRRTRDHKYQSSEANSDLQSRPTKGKRTHYESSNVQLSSRHIPDTQHESPWIIPADLDPEWLAFEVYLEASDSESDDEDLRQTGEMQASERMNTAKIPSQELSPGNDIVTPLSKLNLGKSSEISGSQETDPNSNPYGLDVHVKTSLSLLEVLLRLTSLQQFQQKTHLSIEDEYLNFFLSESATTGAAGGDEHERRALREEARRRVGFDPYNESPVKRRGEEYQYRNDSGHTSLTPKNEVTLSSEEHPLRFVPRPNLFPSPLESSRRSSSDFPPMRLKNSPRFSRHGTPGSQIPSDPLSPAFISPSPLEGKQPPSLPTSSAVKED